MLGLRLVCVGKLKEKFYIDAAGEYIKRLSGYCAPEVVELAEERLPGDPTPGDISAALLKESAAIEAKLPRGAAVVALCVEGHTLTSEELSKTVSDYAANGTSKLCFVIGGSHGLHDGVKKKASLRLSLSKMTFPHNLARVMLLEQLYRCFKIAEGGRYHK